MTRNARALQPCGCQAKPWLGGRACSRRTAGASGEAGRNKWRPSSTAAQAPAVQARRTAAAAALRAAPKPPGLPPADSASACSACAPLTCVCWPS